MTPSSARFPHMFSTSQSTMMNNAGELDGSGTINPATLNPAGAFAAPQGPLSRISQSFYGPATPDYNTDSKPRVAVVDTSPRGVKRSRSPEVYREGQLANDDSNPGIIPFRPLIATSPLITIYSYAAFVSPLYQFHASWPLFASSIFLPLFILPSSLFLFSLDKGLQFIREC